MGVESGPATSTTLLGRLRHAPADAAAWQEFVDRYGPQILGWCRTRGLQEADAEDMTQTILAKLLGVMRSFSYDPSQSFRAWLKTLTNNAWRDLMRSSRRDLLLQAAAAEHDLVEECAARDDLAARLEAAHEQDVWAMAQARVRLRVEPTTWEAFRLTAVEERPVTEVATALGLKVAAVYKARSNVQKMLRAEVKYLEGVEA